MDAVFEEIAVNESDCDKNEGNGVEGDISKVVFNDGAKGAAWKKEISLYNLRLLTFHVRKR